MPSTRAQYTIRGVPTDVDQTLRRVAKERRVSLNSYLVHELERIAQEVEEPHRRHDLDFAIGSMLDGQLVDEALEEFSLVDKALWK